VVKNQNSHLQELISNNAEQCSV